MHLKFAVLPSSPERFIKLHISPRLEANPFPWVLARILLAYIDFSKLVTICKLVFIGSWEISKKVVQSKGQFCCELQFTDSKQVDSSHKSIIERKMLIPRKNVSTFPRYFEFHACDSVSLGILLLCILNSLQFFKLCVIIVRLFFLLRKWKTVKVHFFTELSKM